MAVSAPFKNVTSSVDSDELERGILAYWEKEKIFEQSLAQNKQPNESNLFIFYDGPPYATGQPHYGHILQSAIKDTVLRYKTMQGYYVPRRVGWDCHGLPVETLVEKELKFKTKKDIEKYGVARFNAECRRVVMRYVDEFTATLRRIGRWADYEHAYTTLDLPYMESEWWVFQQLWNQELIYQAFRSTPYCIRCATPLSNFEVASNYQMKTDTAVYVLFKIREVADLYAAVWTTTPWTLPGNVAIALHPDIAYVTATHDDKKVLIAKDRLAAVLGDAAVIEKEWNTKELLALTYEPLYSFLPAEGAYRFVPGAHVVVTEGTGLVHMAPAFGEEDMLVSQQHALPVLRTVDTEGNFVPEITPWAGKNIFAANKDIVEDLKTRGVLLRQEEYQHSYPFCWRCDQPLIYYALDTWFVNIGQLKGQMLANNEHIHWVPEHVKEGRFRKGIESAPDWAVSRNRYWSVPVPIWECDACTHRVCLGSVAELEALSGKSGIADIHRPEVDAYTWACSQKGCNGKMRRVEEVLDVWFDSGSMPYAQWHYPFENKEFVERGFPADFIAESIEMTRAWFYVLHVLATALTTPSAKLSLEVKQPAFKNAIASGLIFAEDGRKLSKKLKNYPEIGPAVVQYGADALRLYLLTSARLGEPYRFSEKSLATLRRTTYLTLWNVYSFFVQYAVTHNWSPNPSSHLASDDLLDQWILARVQLLEREVLQHSNEYRIDMAARQFIDFVDDLSNWYVRRSRQRFQKPENEEDRTMAFGTLHSVLVRTATLLAPFMPFIAEEMFRNLTGKASVHLEKLPKETMPPKVTAAHHQLLAHMDEARAVVAAGLRLRAQAGFKVRQPLQTLYVLQQHINEKLVGIIRDEVNVKEVVIGSIPDEADIVQSDAASGAVVGLTTTLSEELKAEGIAREIIRHGQLLRRKAACALDEKIELELEIDETLAGVVEGQREVLMAALQASVLRTSVTSPLQETFTVNGAQVTLGIVRA